MSEFEVESKFELDRRGFEALVSAGEIVRREEQLNVYYDTDWRLAEHSVTLRIRFNDRSAPVLALKLPVSRRGLQRTMREIEFVLSRNSAHGLSSARPISIDIERDLPVQVQRELILLGVRCVQRVGWVRNTRWVLSINDVGAIEIDQLELPDGNVVYEAEIESPDEVTHRRLANFVCASVPNARPSSESKFQRFRRATMQMRRESAAAVLESIRRMPL